MLATLASAADARPLAPPGAADAPTLDLYVGEERRTTLAATHGTATEALAAAVLRAGDPGEAVEGRVVLAARVNGEAFEFVDPPSTALRPGDALSLERETVAEEALDADRLAAEIGGYGNTSSDEERERRRKKRAKGRRPPPKRPVGRLLPLSSPVSLPDRWTCDCFERRRLRFRASRPHNELMVSLFAWHAILRRPSGVGTLGTGRLVLRTALRARLAERGHVEFRENTAPTLDTQRDNPSTPVHAAAEKP
jgi:plasmid stability protein